MLSVLLKIFLSSHNLPWDFILNGLLTLDTRSIISKFRSLASQDPSLTLNNILFRQIIKSYIKQAWNYPTDLKGKFDGLFKLQTPDLYDGNSHLEYYNFYYQYKDHFETTGVKRYKRVFLRQISWKVISLTISNNLKPAANAPNLPLYPRKNLWSFCRKA